MVHSDRPKHTYLSPMNLQTLADFSPSEGGHGLADEERVNGVLIAGTVYRDSCQGRQAMNE